MLCQGTSELYLFLYRRHYFPRFAAHWVGLLCTACKMDSLKPNLETKIRQHFVILHVASILRSNNPLDICLFPRTTFPKYHSYTPSYNHRVNNTDLQYFKTHESKVCKRRVSKRATANIFCTKIEMPLPRSTCAIQVSLRKSHCHLLSIFLKQSCGGRARLHISQLQWSSQTHVLIFAECSLTWNSR